VAVGDSFSTLGPLNQNLITSPEDEHKKSLVDVLE
jgi:hypothetical protein